MQIIYTHTNVYFKKRIQETINTLNPEQKLKHINNTINELKEVYYSGSLGVTLIDMGNIF